jgi:hypothetical protein
VTRDHGPGSNCKARPTLDPEDLAIQIHVSIAPARPVERTDSRVHTRLVPCQEHSRIRSEPKPCCRLRDPSYGMPTCDAGVSHPQKTSNVRASDAQGYPEEEEEVLH